MEQRGYPTEQAADYVGLSRASLVTRRWRGKGPKFIKLGRRVIYLKEDLDTWLESHRDGEPLNRGANQK